MCNGVLVLIAIVITAATVGISLLFLWIGDADID